MLPRDAGSSEPRPTPQPARAVAPARGSNVEATYAAWRAGSPALPPALAAGPDTTTLLKALGRRWFVALALGSVCAVAAAAAAWTLLSPKYTASAQLRIAAAPPKISRSAASVAGMPDVRNEFSTFLKLQATAIRNRYVLNEALKREEVKNLSMVREQPEPIGWLQDEIKVDMTDGSELVTVLMTGSEPAELVTLVNAVIDEYLLEQKKIETRTRGERKEELEKIYNNARDKLRQKRESLKKLADAVGSSEKEALSQKQLNLLANLSEVRRSYNQVKSERTRAENELAAFKVRKQAQEMTPPDVLVNEMVEADPNVKTLAGRVDALRAAVDKFVQSQVREDDPTYKGLRRQLASTQKELDDQRAKVKQVAAKKLQDNARTEQDAELARLQARLTPLLDQEKALKAEFEQVMKDADKIGISSGEITTLKEEIRTEEKTVEEYGSEVAALEVDMRSPPRITKYQEAVAPKKDIKRQLLATILAPVAALFAVGFGVSWWEYRARRIYSADEVVKGLGMRIVGSLPALPPALRTRFAGGEEADALGQGMVESIDGIRTVLLRAASLEATQVVMVTSAAGGEGKTTLAAHLASSLARAGRRTLLVDCDLRSPAAHQLFEQTLQPGFSEVLLAEVDLADAVRPTTAVEGLWLLPAGQWDREVMQALAKDGLKEIFERLKQEFDFVVVDSHPVLAAPDSLVIGQHMDAVLLSLLRDVSQVPRVYAAGQRLSGLGIRVLGAVVNGMRPDDMYGNGYEYSLQAAG